MRSQKAPEDANRDEEARQQELKAQEDARKAQEEAARQQALKAQADAGKAELEARAAKVDLEVMRMRHKEWVKYHVPWYDRDGYSGF